MRICTNCSNYFKLCLAQPWSLQMPKLWFEEAWTWSCTKLLDPLDSSHSPKLISRQGETKQQISILSIHWRAVLLPTVLWKSLIDSKDRPSEGYSYNHAPHPSSPRLWPAHVLYGGLVSLEPFEDVGYDLRSPKSWHESKLGESIIRRRSNTKALTGCMYDRWSS